MRSHDGFPVMRMPQCGAVIGSARLGDARGAVGGAGIQRRSLGLSGRARGRIDGAASVWPALAPIAGHHPAGQFSRRLAVLVPSGAILAPMGRASVWGGWAVGGQSLAPFWVVSASTGKYPPSMVKSPPSMVKSPPSNGEISTFQWGVNVEISTFQWGITPKKIYKKKRI